MPLRIESIELPSNGPLGASAIEGLHDFDLIILEGPNGSGKSTFLNPIGGAAAGSVVKCRDENAKSKQLPTQGFRREVTRRDSVALMTKFADLSDALALAADATRPREEAKLLQRAARELDSDRSEDDLSAPIEVITARTQYLHLDAALDARLIRTVQEYRARATALAARAGVVWPEQLELTDIHARTEAENTIRPTESKIAGWDTVRSIFLQLPPRLDIKSSAISRLVSKRVELIESLGVAHSEMKASQVGSDALHDAALHDLLRAAIEVSTSLERGVQAIGDELAALDVLRECRERARRYLPSLSSMTEGNADSQVECPVCGAACAHNTLRDRLEAQLGAPSHVTNALQSRRNLLTDIRIQLERRLRETRELAEQASAEHTRLKTSLAGLHLSATTTTSWDTEVRTRFEQVRQRLHAWIETHGAHPTIEALETYSDLHAFADEAKYDFDTRIARENATLAEQRFKFVELQKLGELLAARTLLDRMAWRGSIDQHELNQRIEAQRKLWIRVLKETAAEQQALEAHASCAVQSNPKVQDTFRALLAKLHAQPEVQKLRFAGSQLLDGRDGKTPRERELSEGQTVLVNIAATVAVARMLYGHESHLPGFIVFDEPTNALDPESRQAVASFLGGLTCTEYPGQMFIATFDEEFRTQLIRSAQISGRRIGVIRLPSFERGTSFIRRPSAG